jgi:formate dehydrogenase subunit delta
MNLCPGERVVHMANQIARNLALENHAAAAVAAHIRAFWNPRMIADLQDQPGEGLDPLVLEALRVLERGHGD